ncbi:hypothetical protein BDW16_1196 [Sphingomonas koreensis]|nr:hypothetical protein BDW16_1196 [Sphingomonas koreensis]
MTAMRALSSPWTKRLNDPALSDHTTVAGINHGLELAPQRLEVGELAVDLQQMRLGDPVDPGTIMAPVVGQPEQRPHLIK